MMNLIFGKPEKGTLIVGSSGSGMSASFIFPPGMKKETLIDLCIWHKYDSKSFKLNERK